jgi:hypothetical protein
MRRQVALRGKRITVRPLCRAAVGGRAVETEGRARMDWSLGDVFLSMVAFFFWFVFIWMFIGVFADIFRRNDLSGVAKAGWILLIAVIPFIGILIYMIARPMTEQDQQMLHGMQEQYRQESYSAADEIAKLSRLRDEGKITAEEFERLKAKATS